MDRETTVRLGLEKHSLWKPLPDYQVNILFPGVMLTLNEFKHAGQTYCFWPFELWRRKQIQKSKQSSSQSGLACFALMNSFFTRRRTGV